MIFISFIALLGSAMAGGALAFVLRNHSPAKLKWLMAFTGAFIFGITIIHLLPELFHTDKWWTGVFVLLGFLMQIGVEHLSQGIEHGHIHLHHQHDGHNHGTAFAFSMLIGLALHCFMEGMPIAGYEALQDSMGEGHKHSHHDYGASYLLFGVMFHKAPAAFALVTVMLSAGFKKNIVWIMLFFYGMMSPLGALAAKLLHDSQLFSQDVFIGIMALVIGSFLHISTTILFETEDKDHTFKKDKTIAIISGFVLAGLSLFS